MKRKGNDWNGMYLREMNRNKECNEMELSNLV